MLPTHYNARCNARYNAHAVTGDVTRDESPILRTSEATRARERDGKRSVPQNSYYSLFSAVWLWRELEKGNFWPFGQQAIDILAKQNILYDTVLTKLVFSTARY